MPSTTAFSLTTQVIADTPPLPPAPEPGPGSSTGESAGVGFLYADKKIIRGAAWRFIVTDLDTATITNLDKLATSKSVLAQLNAPWESSGEVPSDNPEVNILHTDGYPFLHEGNRLLYGFRREAGGDPLWRCRFGGLIMSVSDVGEQGPARTSYTAYNPWQYLYHRPVLLDDGVGSPTGEFPGEDGAVFAADDSGSEIAVRLLLNSITTEDSNGIAFIDFPSEYGGFGQGIVEDTGPIGDGLTETWEVQQGKSVGEAWDDLVASGTMDIVLDPVYDTGRPGICADLSIYARKGIARDGAGMTWDRPGRSLSGVTRLIDGAQRANRIRFLAGQGGSGLTCDEFVDPASILIFKEYVIQQFFPDKPTCAMVHTLAEQMLSLRSRGLTTITANPAAERSASPLLEYEPGDTVPFYATTHLRQAVADNLRVQSIPIEIDDNGVETVRGLLLSTETEGIS